MIRTSHHYRLNAALLELQDAMAGNSKALLLSERVYKSLESLGCPLVDGLYLREADSMQQLLCTPSLHRMDILKWICARICPSLREKFFTIKSEQMEEVVKEITRFGYEMMLCRANEHGIIQGLAPPLRQLMFLEQLIMIAQDDNTPSENSEKSFRDGVRNEDLLKDLMSPDHFSDLIKLLNPVCNPWSVHICEQLRATQSTQSKASHSKANDSVDRSHQKSGLAKLGDEDLAEATALLQSTRSIFEELCKDFLQSDSSGPGISLSSCALKVAISDMAQLMSAFSQVFNADFRGYCQRPPPVLSTSTSVFQSVQQLLHICNMKLEALQHLAETSSSLTETVRHIQTDRRYWAKGEKQTLVNQLEALRTRYSAFLSHH